MNRNHTATLPTRRNAARVTNSADRQPTTLRQRPSRTVDASAWAEASEYAAPLSSFTEALDAYAERMADADAFAYGYRD